MCAAGALRGAPPSITTTRRRARPNTSAALKPAAPPPTITTSISLCVSIVSTSTARVRQRFEMDNFCCRFRESGAVQGMKTVD
jgi:hypothetical protein